MGYYKNISLLFKKPAGSSIPTQIQKKTYGSSTNVTSHSVVMDAAPITGHLLVLCVTSDTVISGTPSGWTLIQSAVDNTGSYMYYKVSAGTEQTTTVTLSTSESCCLTIFEYSGVATLDKSAQATGQGGAGTVNTGTTAATTAANEVVIVMAGLSLLSTLGQQVSSWSNSFTLEGNCASSNFSGTYVSQGTGSKILSATGTQTSIATLSSTNGSHNSGIIACFK